MKKIPYTVLAGLLTTALTACSFTTVSGPLEGKESQDIYVIAVLPPQINGDISRERAQLVHKLVADQLEGKGYLVIDGQTVSRICGSSDCKNRSDLVSKLGAQGIVENRIDSVSRTNFIAGYINTVKGSLVFRDAQNNELVSVDHVKRERGGLLFNTGQIVQALIQTAANTKTDESFSVLAGLYAKDLVDELPRSVRQANAINPKTAAMISDTVVTSEGNGSDRVCVKGTPSSTATLVYQRTRTSLREIRSGNYCGLFQLADFPSGAALAVELRSPYGEVERKQLKIPENNTCELANAVNLTEDAKRVKLQVQCDATSKLKKFLVYAGATNFGPFQKIGEFKGQSWSGPVMKDRVYAVVAVSQQGELSSPVVVSSKAS